MPEGNPAAYKQQPMGEKLNFKGEPPKVWPDGSEQDVDFDSVAPDRAPDDRLSDTYQGIPGDGIVPG